MLCSTVDGIHHLEYYIIRRTSANYEWIAKKSYCLQSMEKCPPVSG